MNAPVAQASVIALEILDTKSTKPGFPAMENVLLAIYFLVFTSQATSPECNRNMMASADDNSGNWGQLTHRQDYCGLILYQRGNSALVENLYI